MEWAKFLELRRRFTRLSARYNAVSDPKVKLQILGKIQKVVNSPCRLAVSRYESYSDDDVFGN